MPGLVRHVFVCINEREADNPKGCCMRKGGEEVRAEFKKLIAERGLRGEVRANAAGCLDQCASGVTVLVYPEQVWYGGVTTADVAEIVDRHIVKGEYVQRLMLPDQKHLAGSTRGIPLKKS